MLTTVLIGIGLLLIIFSLFFISRESKKDIGIHNDIKALYAEIKDYFHSIEEMINSFEEILEGSLHKIENLEETKESIVTNDDMSFRKNDVCGYDYIDEENNTAMRKVISEKNKFQQNGERILELKEMGLSNEQIAKHLNKGIREVDIILKMGSNNIDKK